MKRHASYISALVLIAPSFALASNSTDTLSEIAGLFNIFVGLMLVLAMLLWGGGMIVWAVRLGTFPSYRDRAIDILQWSVATLFVLVVLLGLVEYIQRHTQTALSILGVIVFILIVWLVIKSGVFAKGDEKEEE